MLKKVFMLSALFLSDGLAVRKPAARANANTSYLVYGLGAVSVLGVLGTTIFGVLWARAGYPNFAAGLRLISEENLSAVKGAIEGEARNPKNPVEFYVVEQHTEETFLADKGSFVVKDSTLRKITVLEYINLIGSNKYKSIEPVDSSAGEITTKGFCLIAKAA